MIQVHSIERAIFRVLWHPEGTPAEVEGVRVDSEFCYARTRRGDWWRLSDENRDGWRAPSIKIADPQRISDYNSTIGAGE